MQFLCVHVPALAASCGDRESVDCFVQWMLAGDWCPILLNARVPDPVDEIVNFHGRIESVIRYVASACIKCVVSVLTDAPRTSL